MQCLQEHDHNLNHDNCDDDINEKDKEEEGGRGKKRRQGKDGGDGMMIVSSVITDAYRSTTDRTKMASANCNTKPM